MLSCFLTILFGNMTWFCHNCIYVNILVFYKMYVCACTHAHTCTHTHTHHALYGQHTFIIKLSRFGSRQASSCPRFVFHFFPLISYFLGFLNLLFLWHWDQHFPSKSLRISRSSFCKTRLHYVNAILFTVEITTDSRNLIVKSWQSSKQLLLGVLGVWLNFKYIWQAF